MAVIGGPPIDREIIGIMRISAPGRDAGAIGGIRIAARMIGIGLIGEGGSQKRNRCGGRAARGQHIEGDVILTFGTTDMQRVGAGTQIRWHFEAEIICPAAIAQIIGVEMDGGVIGGRVAPAHLGPRPARPHHGAGWHIHQIAVAGLRADIFHALRCNAARKIPTGEKPGRGSGKRLIGPRPFGEKPSPYSGIFDLARQMRACCGGVFRGNHHHARAIGQRQASRRDFAHAGGAGIFNALCAEQHAPRGGIGAQPQPMPTAQGQGCAKAKLPLSSRPDKARHWPMRADRKRDAVPRLFFADHHSLAAGLRLEPDQRCPGDRPRHALRRLWDQRIRPKPDGLVAALKCGIETR